MRVCKCVCVHVCINTSGAPAAHQPCRREAEPPLDYAVRVFARAYTHDIERLAAVKVSSQM